MMHSSILNIPGDYDRLILIIKVKTSVMAHDKNPLVDYDHLRYSLYASGYRGRRDAHAIVPPSGSP